tara:strand:- start:444 stop:1763 length:1320 start_codon:yes stop_codon:yes gene_type:complete
MTSLSRIFYLLIGIVLLASCSSTRKANRTISHTLKDSLFFKQGFAGLALYDPIANEMLYTHNADKYFTPASNTKLFTFYTGLTVLGDSVPALKYYTSGDSLVFKGTGDPSFLNPDLPESKVLKFLKDRKEQLFYLPPTYQEAYFGPGWSWDDFNSYYSVERSAFPIYGNRVTFTQKEHFTLPQAYPVYFQQMLLPDSLNLKDSRRIKREMASNNFAYGLIERDSGYSQDVPIKYSPELFVTLLKDTLKKDVQIINTLPESFINERTLYSIPTDSIYKRMLKVSDNFIAEQILLMASEEIADTLKTDIAIEFMKDNFLNDLPDQPQWVDGSGLSRYNLFTPRTLVKLLEKIKDKMPQDKLFGLMAVGGKSGTLENYYSAEEPYIFAKTGSLSNNHSLSGFIKTRSGRVLIFSFMNSNYTIPTRELKKGMERILLTIRDNY